MRVFAYSLLCLGMGWGIDCTAQQSGGLDSLFHFDGELVLADFDSIGNPVVVATEDMGAVVAFRQTVDGAPVTQMVRLLEDGSLNTNFGTGGVVTSTTLGQFLDLVIQADGNLLLIGHVANAGDTGIVVERSEAMGALDGTYGSGGRVLVPGTDSLNYSPKYGGTILPDDRLVLHLNDRIIRLTVDGAIDPSFGVLGVLLVPTGVGTIAVTPAGKLRWSRMGWSSEPNEVDFDGQDALVGYYLNPSPGPATDPWIYGPFVVNQYDNSFGHCSGLPITGMHGTVEFSGFGRADYLGYYQAFPHGWGHHGNIEWFPVFKPGSYGNPNVGGSLGPVAADQAGNFLMAYSYTLYSYYDQGTNWYPVELPLAPVWKVKRSALNSDDLDPSFGVGNSPLDVTGVDASFDTTAIPIPRSMAVQPDGKVVVAGTCVVGGIKRVVLARYHNIPDPRAKLDLKFFLGGPMDNNAGLMHDSLRAQGILPLQQPYQDSAFQSVNGVGTGMTSTSVLNEIGPDAAVDWVWLELLDAADTATVVATRTGLLRRNGKVTSPINHDPIDFSVGVGNYFLRVRHRNHLGVTLSDPIVLSDSVVSVDLSDPTTNTFGVDAQKWINGVHMLWPGDVNHDGLVRYAGAANDRDAVLVAIDGSPPTATTTGYKNADVNMDGIVKYAGVDNDRDVILQTVGGGYPTVVRFEQRP